MGPFRTAVLVLVVLAVAQLLYADRGAVHSLSYSLQRTIVLTVTPGDVQGLYPTPDNCTTCMANETMEETSVCSNATALYTLSFQDPLGTYAPVSGITSYILVSVNVTLMGRFNCLPKVPSSPSIVVLLDNSFVPFAQPPVSPVDCSCALCAFPLSGSGTAPFGIGWPNYQTNAVNSLSIRPIDVLMCISTAQLSLVYMPSPPQVGDVTPLYGPVAGHTQIVVSGSGFRTPDQQQITCQLGTTFPAVEAVYTGPQSVYFFSPSSPTGPLKNLPISCTAYQDQRKYPILAPTQYFFTYYDDPVVTVIRPDFGPPDGGYNVLVLGSGFIDTGTILMKFGQGQATCNFLNSSAINCTSPPGFGDVNVQVSLNGIDFSPSEVSFSYRYLPPPSPINWPVVVTAIAAFAGFAVLTCISMVLYTVFSRAPDYGGPPNEGTRLLRSEHGSDPEITSEISLGEVIGRGTHGEVYKGTWHGTTVAVKKFINSYSPEFAADLQREAAIMRSLRHPNVLQFLAACTIPPNICIVMEYMPGGSLYKALHTPSRTFTLEQIRNIMLDAARGMNYLHKSHPIILHRDLKSHNLLLDENLKCKVCDFGLSRILDTADVNTLTACGTPCWAAPEVLRSERYTEKADIFSYGIVLWECFSREVPYNGLLPFQIIHAVGTLGKRPDMPPGTPEAAARLIRRCWDESPDVRPDFDFIIQELTQLSDPHWICPPVRNPA